jgi:hypothetical protein
MFYDKFHVVEYAKCSKCLQTDTRKGYSLLFLAISQLLHGWFMFTQSLFVIGQVIIFSFNQRSSASHIALETSFSIDVTRLKTLEFT